jgi:hypothetical protein
MALLASDAPRSEHDPDLEAAAAIAMHPVTGAFADPTHESAFAAQFFRLAFPAHAFLIPLNLTVFTWAATQASIDAVRGESDGGELVDGYNCVDRGIEKKERDNQRKRGYRWRC